MLLMAVWAFNVQALAASHSSHLTIPRADNTFWRDSVPETMRQSYITYGEQWFCKPWTVLPWTVFAENKINGNRVNYEAVCFEKRRQLAAIVMAEIIEGKGRFLNDIINGLGSFCEETWWGIPAHYGKRIPLTDTQEVDLFNAETASLIAWTKYMLQPQLDAFSPDLCQRIDREIERRILTPALQHNYWWKTAGMNWNPWICSNWLACVLICEKDSTRREAAIGQIMKATQAFIDAYPEDGGCDEGPGYWDRAAASMFEVLWLREKVKVYSEKFAAAIPSAPMPSADGTAAVNHSLFTIPSSLKINNMAAYAYKTYIGNDYCVNFADAHDNKTLLQVNIVYPFGLWLNDKTMRQFGAYLGRQKDILNHPAALYDKSGNFPTLGRELLFLSHIQDFLREIPQEPVLKDVWLPDLQIMTARRGQLFLAMKGGNNGESHNHNDVGSFIVYASSSGKATGGREQVGNGSGGVSPLIIDAGVGEYTAKTFGNNRYDIWTMQSQYHNLPQINGVDQKDGKAYAASVVSHKAGALCLDIAKAYPESAAVRSWKRTVSVTKQGVAVTEDYELTEYRNPAKLMLLTLEKPEAANPGTITLGAHRISYDARSLDVSVEDISPLLDPLLQRVWGQQMYRIVLTVRSQANKNTVKYLIQ